MLVELDKKGTSDERQEDDIDVLANDSLEDSM